MSEDLVTVKVKKGTLNALKKQANYGDSMDDVVNRLLSKSVKTERKGVAN